MIPYGTMPTGKETGLIEIVRKSFTLAKIHKQVYGNTSGALRKDTLHTWMKRVNTDSEYVKVCAVHMQLIFEG